MKSFQDKNVKVTVLVFYGCLTNQHKHIKSKKKKRKGSEPEIKLPTSAGSVKKQENSRKASTCVLLITEKPLIVWITTNWKILQEKEE